MHRTLKSEGGEAAPGARSGKGAERLQPRRRRRENVSDPLIVRPQPTHIE